MGPIQLLFIMLLHMLPLFIMLLDMESPMLLTLLVFMALLLLLSQLFMVPMQVLEDTSPTLLELFMLPNVKQRLILMLLQCIWIWGLWSWTQSLFSWIWPSSWILHPWIWSWFWIWTWLWILWISRKTTH